MDNEVRDYNLRTQQKGKSQPNTTNKSKNSDKMTSVIEQNTSGAAISSDTSLHEDRTRSTPGAAMIPQELATFMGESRASFTQLNGKLDKFMDEMANMKIDLAKTKKNVSDLEAGLTYTSEKVSDIEKKDLPQLRNTIDKKIEELDEKITLSEIHDRKLNLLVYGLQPTNGKENIYDVVHEVFIHLMGISKEEASRIPLANAHRLPPSTRAATGSPQPPAIIIRFARMIDRDRLLYGFERRPRQQSTDSSADTSSAQLPPPSPFSRVTIRTDLPPKLKRERGRLASIAYSLRKKDHLATRIKIVGTKVMLQTRKTTRNGATPEHWSSWSEPGNGEE